MINVHTTNRIIGDYLEVNSYIVSQQFYSKLPKFMSRYRANKQRKRLLESLSKFRRSGYILEWDNLIELFTYIYNNFDQDHSYKNITKVELMEDSLEALIEFDNYHALIFFDRLSNNVDSDTDIKFNLKMKYITNVKTDGVDIYLSTLYTTHRKAYNYVKQLNDLLVNYTCDYIEDILKKYMGG